MNKKLTVSELAADLPARVDDVKHGDTLTIIENGQEIATITPTIVQPGVRHPFRNFDFGKRPANLKLDPADIIIEEREHERSGKKFGF
jgi:antitoxin (DNA-binding transcriptional repressor) of toxin-antitoxin stability system